MARPPFQIGDFIGQKNVLAPILREQDGARARGEPLPAMLLPGQSGLGKSLLGRTLAKRAGTAMTRFNGTESVEEVVRRLRLMNDGDVAFFDECHKLAHEVQEVLYDVMDSATIPADIVPNAADSQPVKIAPLTLIFATDQPGRLLYALRKRIATIVGLKPYSDGEMKEIVARVATRRNLLLSPQAARQLAKVCNGLPRRAEHHVQKLRLYYEDSERRKLGLADIQEFLQARGIDADGLGEHERAVLEFLAENRAASLEALAGYLGTDPAYVRAQIEQPLRYRGLITVRPSGRVLTSQGREWVRQQCRSSKTKNYKTDEEE